MPRILFLLMIALAALAAPVLAQSAVDAAPAPAAEAAAAPVAAPAAAQAEVYIVYDDALGVPLICAGGLKTAPSFPVELGQPEFVFKTVKDCKADFAVVGRNDQGEWIIRVQPKGEEEWHFPAGTEVVLRKFDVAKLKETIQPGHHPHPPEPLHPRLAVHR